VGVGDRHDQLERRHDRPPGLLVGLRPLLELLGRDVGRRPPEDAEQRRLRGPVVGDHPVVGEQPPAAARQPRRRRHLADALGHVGGARRQGL
jgi:hypothetical protein